MRFKPNLRLTGNFDEKHCQIRRGGLTIHSSNMDTSRILPDTSHAKGRSSTCMTYYRSFFKQESQNRKDLFKKYRYKNFQKYMDKRCQKEVEGLKMQTLTYANIKDIHIYENLEEIEE